MADQVHYASNFRSFLTGLVVLHHTAISYGGEGANLFRSSHHPPGSSAALVGFNAVNQSFFMGSFFFLAGHYSKESLQYKSREQFIKGRLYRLALPTIAYSILAPPVCYAIMQTARGQALTWSSIIDPLISTRGVRGPVWFTSILLVFDTTLALLETRTKPDVASKKNAQSKSKLPILFQGLGVDSAVALCSVADFVWRIKFPVNRMFLPFNLNLGYLPQYIATYWFGLRVVSPYEAVTAPAVNMRLLIVSLASSLALINIFRRNGKNAFPQLLGGFNPGAAAYAVWNNATGYLLGNLLLFVFSTNCNTSWGWINASAFPAFLVHIPVSVFVGAYTDQWEATGVTKAAVIGLVNIAASWAVGSCAKALWERIMTPKLRQERKID